MTAASSQVHGDPGPSGSGDMRRALGDIGGAVERWRLVVLLGVDDVAARYRRSALGQFWLTLSNALLVLAVGLVWSHIWKQPVSAFLPYFATGQVVWLLLTVTMIDASTAFSSSAAYLRELALPRSTYLLANIVKHLVIFGHNLVIVPPVLLLFGPAPTWNTLLFVPGLALTVATLAAASFWIGVAGLRFRDVPALAASVVTVLFFLTPVIWREELIDEHLRAFLIVNPLHVFLELLRAPLLGAAPRPHYWLVALGILLANAAVGFIVFARSRRWITYWL